MHPVNDVPAVATYVLSPDPKSTLFNAQPNYEIVGDGMPDGNKVMEAFRAVKAGFPCKITLHRPIHPGIFEFHVSIPVQYTVLDAPPAANAKPCRHVYVMTTSKTFRHSSTAVFGTGGGREVHPGFKTGQNSVIIIWKK